MSEHDTYDDLAESVQTNTNVTQAERETSITFSRADDRADIYCEEQAMMKRLLLHPDFELDFYHTSHPDRVTGVVEGDEYEEDGHDGRKPVYAIRGTIPIGCLKVGPSPRSSSGHADVVTSKWL